MILNHCIRKTILIKGSLPNNKIKIKIHKFGFINVLFKAIKYIIFINSVSLLQISILRSTLTNFNVSITILNILMTINYY